MSFTKWFCGCVDGDGKLILCGKSVPECTVRTAQWERYAESLGRRPNISDEARRLLLDLVAFSPYVDFEDADGKCFFCRSDPHIKDCLHAQALELLRRA